MGLDGWEWDIPPELYGLDRNMGLSLGIGFSMGWRLLALGLEDGGEVMSW